MHFALVANDFAIGSCLAESQLFSQAIKDLPNVLGPSSVEAKGELIQVALQMFRADLAVMRAQQPALEKRGHQVDLGKGLDSLFLSGTDMTDVMMESACCQTGIALPTICVHDRGGFDGLLDESDQMLRRRLGDAAESNPTDLPAFQFDRYDHERLVLQAPPTNALAYLFTAYVGFVHLHGSSQWFTLNSHHGLTQLLQHKPGGTVTSEAQFSLQAGGTEPGLLRAGQPHSQEPTRHRQMTLVQNGPGRQRGLSATMGAECRAARRGPALATLAGRTHESIRPTQAHQVLPTSPCVRKPSRELDQVFRKLVNHSRTLTRELPRAKCISSFLEFVNSQIRKAFRPSAESPKQSRGWPGGRAGLTRTGTPPPFLLEPATLSLANRSAFLGYVRAEGGRKRGWRHEKRGQEKKPAGGILA